MSANEIVLITGSSGYIGSALTKKLSVHFKIIGLDRDIPKKKVEGVDYYALDFSSSDELHKVIKELRQKFGTKIKSVIHLVAYYSFSGEESDLYQKITVEGSGNLLRTLNEFFQVEQFVFSSTMLVHEPASSGEEIDEESPVSPSWPYPQSKVKAEEIIAREKGDVKVVNLRIAGIYDDYGHSVPIGNHIMRIYEQHFSSLLFPGNYHNRQSYLHLEDLLEAIFLLIKKSESLPDSITLVLGEDEALSFKELQSLIGKELYGKEWPIIRVPPFFARTGAYLLQKLPMVREPFIKPWMISYADDHYDLNINKVKEVLNWEPRHRLRETLPKMITALKTNPRRWYKEHKMVAPTYRDLVTSAVGETTYRFAVLLNIFLGLLVFSNPFMLDNLSSLEFTNDLIVGFLVILFSIISLIPTLRWVRWITALTAVWLMFSPLVFWSQEAAVYSNNTILSALILMISAYTPSRNIEAPGEIPSGWSYNPSEWTQRVPIMFLAFLGFLMARYLSAYQLGHISTIWDPFFGDGTARILTSDISKAFPISDAGLGALSYLLDVVAAAIGDKNRWKTMPWMVVLFGLLIIPTGVTSIVLVMLQPIGVGAWCTLCLITAVVMLLMVPPAVDEVCASVQFLRRSLKEGKTFWRTFLMGSDEGEEEDKKAVPREPVEYAFPFHILLSTILGAWLLFTPYVLGISGIEATNLYISGALIVTFAVIALSEIARIVRIFNVFGGFWIAISAWMIGNMDLTAALHSTILGLILMALSLPRGKIREHFGSLDSWSRWSPLSQ